MNEFGRYSSSIIGLRSVFDLENTTECMKPATRKCLEKQRIQYLIGVIQLILVSILLLILAVSFCVLVHMNTEFARLKERVDILEMSKLVDYPSEINKLISIQQDEQKNLNMDIFNMMSAGHAPRDEIDENFDKTRNSKIDFQNMNISVFDLSNENEKREGIIMPVTLNKIGRDYRDIYSEVIEMDEAKKAQHEDHDIVLHTSLKSVARDSHHNVLTNSKNTVSTSKRFTQDRSSHLRKKRNIKENLRKPKPEPRIIRRHTAAIHLNSSVLDNISGEHLLKLGSGELKRISLDHGTLTKLGYQPLRGDCNNQDCFIYKAWTPSSWTNVADFVFLPTSGRVQIKKRGLYYIYAQILYHNAATRNSYEIMINEAAFVKCMTSVDWVSQDPTTVDSNAKYKNCYTGGVTMLNKNQEIYIKDGYGHITDSTANFFGIIKIADA